MNTTFIRSCHILLISTLCMTPAWADGTITHLSGEISVQKKDGTILPGMVGTKVNAGDVMITGANGYGRLEMTDGGEMVLRPNSQLKVESYRFQTDKPADDSFVFHMLKGGLRTVTGLIGKRGNKDAYEGKAASATIGIRGTQFDLRLCQGDCGVLADGTYLAVRFGAVRTGNAQGNLDVAAGQVALVQAAKPPVILPRDPGIGFTPPAVIPKLDEKKKVQAATTAAATTPAQEKPAESSSEKSSQSSTESSEKKDSKSSESSSTKSTSEKASSESGTEAKDSSSSDSGKKSGTDTGGNSESSSKPSGATSNTTESTAGAKDSGGGGAVSGGKSEPSSSSSSGTSSNTTSGSGGSGQGSSATQSNSVAPAQQKAPGMDCSVQ